MAPRQEGGILSTVWKGELLVASPILIMCIYLRGGTSADINECDVVAGRRSLTWTTLSTAIKPQSSSTFYVTENIFLTYLQVSNLEECAQMCLTALSVTGHRSIKKKNCVISSQEVVFGWKDAKRKLAFSAHLWFLFPPLTLLNHILHLEAEGHIVSWL